MTEHDKAPYGPKVDHTAPKVSVPKGACDCHVHVFGPDARYPFAEGRTYTPENATLENLVAHLAAIRFDRVVIVHPSPYGTDNTASLESAQALGSDRARVVAVLAEDVGAKELDALHAKGVRGVRINLETAGVRDPEVARARLIKEAERAAPLGWHVQTYARLDVIAAVRDTIERLPAALVVDHFGHTPAAGGVTQPGFGAITDLMRSGKMYVKLSAPYLISTAPDYADAEALAQAMIAANENRVLWASNWPHPGGTPATRRPDVVQPFRRVDDGLALDRMGLWVRDPGQWQKLLVDNAARLYGF